MGVDLSRSNRRSMKKTLLILSCRRVHRKFLTVPEPVNGAPGAWNDAATLH